MLAPCEPQRVFIEHNNKYRVTAEVFAGRSPELTLWISVLDFVAKAGCKMDIRDIFPSKILKWVNCSAINMDRKALGPLQRTKAVLLP